MGVESRELHPVMKAAVAVSEGTEFFQRKSRNLNPTMEDMRRCRTRIKDDEFKIDPGVLENRIKNIDAQDHMIITGQNEIISTHRNELKCIDIKLNNIRLLLHQNTTNVSQCTTHIQQVEDKLDQMLAKVLKIFDQLKC